MFVRVFVGWAATYFAIAPHPRRSVSTSSAASMHDLDWCVGKSMNSRTSIQFNSVPPSKGKVLYSSHKASGKEAGIDYANDAAPVLPSHVLLQRAHDSVDRTQAETLVDVKTVAVIHSCYERARAHVRAAGAELRAGSGAVPDPRLVQANG